MAPLTRQEFYELSDRCREQALELAKHDQSRVNPEQCRRFNIWLAELKDYDQLAPALVGMGTARPLTRWHIMGGIIGLWLIGSFLLADQLGPMGLRLLSLGALGTGILFFFIPEELYGTTVELLEGKLLRIVEVLEELLFSRQMELSEAVFFQVKENLESARRELRQQIHLAHGRW